MQETESLVKWGWITTVLIWPVGAIIGVVLLTKNRVGHGVAMLCVCAVWAFVAFVLIDSISQGAELGDMEGFITSGLVSQVEGDIGDVSCVRDTDTHATCFAKVYTAEFGDENVAIDVNIDQNTGEYVWQARAPVQADR